MKVRAERQAETRRRIVEAAAHLHATLGPAATSVSAIAERAGVQRHTVYAHFADDRLLFGACSAHWAEAHPYPDVASLDLRDALLAVYAWFEENETALALFARDAHLYPEVRAARERARGRLARRLAAQLGSRRAPRAAVGHALSFETWRSLVRAEGLTRRQAVDAMVAFARAV